MAIYLAKTYTYIKVSPTPCEHASPRRVVVCGARGLRPACGSARVGWAIFYPNTYTYIKVSLGACEPHACRRASGAGAGSPGAGPGRDSNPQREAGIPTPDLTPLPRMGVGGVRRRNAVQFSLLPGHLQPMHPFLGGNSSSHLNIVVVTYI